MVHIAGDSMLQSRSCYTKFCCIFHRHACNQSIDQTAGKTITTTYTVYDTHFILTGMMKVGAIIYQCTPSIITGAMTFPKRRSNELEAKFFFHLFEYIFESIEVQLS